MYDNLEDTPPSMLEERVKGNQASYILENEAYKEAMLQMKAAVLGAWRTTKLDASKERDYYWLQMKAIDALETNLESLIDTGKMATIQMEVEDRKLLQKLKEKIMS